MRTCKREFLQVIDVQYATGLFYADWYSLPHQLGGFGHPFFYLVSRSWWSGNSAMKMARRRGQSLTITPFTSSVILNPFSTYWKSDLYPTRRPLLCLICLPLITNQYCGWMIRSLIAPAACRSCSSLHLIASRLLSCVWPALHCDLTARYFPKRFML